jgi:cytochrome P450
LTKYIKDIKNSKGDGDQTTIFYGMLDERLPDSLKSTDRLLQEGRVLMAAGTHTTAMTMSNLIFHLLSDPARLKKLRHELVTAIPDAGRTPSASQVENLPYLVSHNNLVCWHHLFYND